MTSPGCFVSVDLEDYKQTATLEMGVPCRTAPERTARGVARILDVLRRSPGDPRATFFTTGQVARDQPDLVAMLSRAGHEIGCHGDRHEDVRDLGPAGFAADLDRAAAALTAAGGRPVVGFRAPNFSIDGDSLWALEVLAGAGFRYDSSLVAGAPRAARVPYDAYRICGRPFLEFPVCRFGLAPGVGVRVIGGTYLRLLPLAVILRLMRKAAGAGYAPMVYVHPADLDDGFEPVRRHEMAGLGGLARVTWGLRQRQWSAGTSGAAAKLAAILRAFPNRGPLAAALDGDPRRPAARREPAPAAAGR